MGLTKYCGLAALNSSASFCSSATWLAPVKACQNSISNEPGAAVTPGGGGVAVGAGVFDGPAGAAVAAAVAAVVAAVVAAAVGAVVGAVVAASVGAVVGS